MAILKVANIHFDAAGTTVIRANGANTLTFNTAGSEDARIDAAGNVLIGRTNSTVGQGVKLDVAGGINSSAILINGSSVIDTLNGANAITNAAFTQANTARDHANTAHASANAAFTQANTARTHANSAFDQANTGRSHANSAFNHANAAFIRANSAVLNNATTLITTGYTVNTFIASANVSAFGTWQPNPANGNYQLATANGAVTITTPPANCAIDILFVNASNRNPGAVSFTGYNVSATPGSTYAVTANQRYMLSIRAINNIATYSWYGMQ